MKSVVYRKAPFSLDLLFSHRVFFDWAWESEGYVMYPCDGALWFLRNLFIVSLAAPVVFWFVKRIRPNIGIPMLATLYVLNITRSNDMGLVSTFCFFTLGAYIGINRWNVLPFISAKGRYCFVAYIACILTDLAIMNTLDMHIYLYRFAILLGLPSLAYATYRLPSSYKNIEFPSLSMFIYCAHGIMLEPVVSLGRHSGIDCKIIVFSGNIILTVLLCIIGYVVLKHLKPAWIGRILMGGRI